MDITTNRAFWQAKSTNIELLHTTIGDLLDQQADFFPDKEALVYAYPERGLDLRLTYRELRDEVNLVARGLLGLGIEQGEHVAVWAPNVPEWIFLELALAKIGAVLVTVNTAYRAAELAYLLRQGDITTFFMVEELRDNSYLDSVYQIVPELRAMRDPASDMLHSAALPRLKRVVLLGETNRPSCLRYAHVVDLHRSVPDETLAARQRSIAPDDAAQIQYTSGTTGFPKGAVISHMGHLNSAYLFAARTGIQSSDRMVSAMPLFHVAGCVGGLLTMLVTGGTLIPLITFDPAKQLELISQEQATLCWGVPTMLLAMLNHPRFLAGEFDTSSLRMVISGGSPVPVVLMEQMKAKMGADLVIAFGMTEASGYISHTLSTDTYELRSATVGIPLPHVDVQLVDLQTGKPVGFGERGELLTRGFLVMKGYYNMPEKTAEVIDADGWLHTGDLATMNPQGYLAIVGRVKELVIRGGENLYPAEIEAFLLRHPKVAEAQVIGVPDPVMGEELVALLKLKPGEQADEGEIRAYCQGAISKHKIPKYIRFVTAYPLTTSGKVKKFELRAQMIEALRLQEEVHDV